MLPDFPESKGEYFKLLCEAFAKRKAASLGVFAEIKESPLHEGHRAILVRPDGTEEETEFKKVSVEYKLSMDDERKMSDEELFENFMGMADEMAEKQSGFTLTAIDEAVSKVGNVTVSEQVGPQTLLDALEKMQIPFASDGRHEDLTLVSGPAMQEQLRATFRLLESDPVWRKKYHDLMFRKREEWHARESSRKLVG